MTILSYIIFANSLISLASLLGVFTLSLKEEVLNRMLLALVSLSAGALIGGAFFHLIPEAYEKFKNDQVFFFVVAGFILFFVIEKIFHWRHCHQGKCKVHPFGYLSLIGDAIHNFLDGLIIAGAFLVNVKLGLVTSLMVALHEVPQEVGDFGVLLYAGFKRQQALWLNFLVALTSVFGGFIGYLISLSSFQLERYLLPIAAGGFLYIAASDLMPELRKEADLKKSIISFSIFILGVIITFSTKSF